MKVDLLENRERVSVKCIKIKIQSKWCWLLQGLELKSLLVLLKIVLVGDGALQIGHIGACTI